MAQLANGEESAPRCLALAGPTAAGKTAAAMVLAQEYPLEIISMDSALVYRGMDIGTAKPSAAERAAVPHHLIDIRDPLQTYNAADFARAARRLIAEINARGKLALLVGGTMLYFKALQHGLHDMPAADPQARAGIEHEAAQVGWPAMHARLQQLDPATAARLQPRDSQRIQRALEIVRVSGRPMSDFHKTNLGSSGVVPFAPVPLVSLEPLQRTWLHERIAARFDAMLVAGFLDEVLALRARGDLTPDLPAMRCVGYRQAWEVLDGNCPMKDLRDKSIFATRQLAKRQLTWLRALAGRHVLACDGPDITSLVLARAAQLLDAAP